MAASVVYIVAISQQEAESIARDGNWESLHHLTKAAANEHLKEVKAPPTDPFYASQFRVFTVRLK
jgi:hypothetical protein